MSRIGSTAGLVLRHWTATATVVVALAVAALLPCTGSGYTDFAPPGIRWAAWYEEEGISFMIHAERAGTFHVPLGSVFVSDDRARQALLIPDDAGILLREGERNNIYVSVHCMDQNLDAPDEGAQVRYYGNAGPHVRRILMHDGWLNSEEEQRLVWLHTARHPLRPVPP